MGRKANQLQAEVNRIAAMLPVRSDDDGDVTTSGLYMGVRRMLEQLGTYERQFARLAELIDNKYGRIRPITIDTIENGVRQLLSERDRARVTQREDVNQAGLRRLSEALGPHGKGYLDTLSFDDIQEAISSIRGLHQLALEDAQALVRQLEDAEGQVVSYRKALDRNQRRLDAFAEVRDRIARAMEAEGFTGGVEEQVVRMIRFLNHLRLNTEFTMSAEQVNELGDKRAAIMRRYAETSGQSLLSYVDSYGSQLPTSFADGGVVPPKLYREGGLINPNGESR